MLFLIIIKILSEKGNIWQIQMFQSLISGLPGIAPKIRKPELFIILASRAGNCSLQKGVNNMLKPEEKKNLIKMYNDKLNSTFKKTSQGEVINLTELFIQKEMLENTLRG